MNVCNHLNAYNQPSVVKSTQGAKSQEIFVKRLEIQGILSKYIFELGNPIINASNQIIWV